MNKQQIKEIIQAKRTGIDWYPEHLNPEWMRIYQEILQEERGPEEYHDEVNQPVPVFGEEIKKLLDTGNLIDNSRIIMPSNIKYTLHSPDGKTREVTKEEAEKWAEEELAKRWSDVDQKLSNDLLQYGQAAVHISNEGEVTHIDAHPNNLYINRQQSEPVYQSLEEIAGEIIYAKSIEDHSDANEELTCILKKLQASISQGKYLCNNGTE